MNALTIIWLLALTLFNYFVMKSLYATALPFFVYFGTRLIDTSLIKIEGD